MVCDALSRRKERLGKRLAEELVEVAARPGEARRRPGKEEKNRTALHPRWCETRRARRARGLFYCYCSGTLLLLLGLFPEGLKTLGNLELWRSRISIVTSVVAALCCEGPTPPRGGNVNSEW